MRPPSPTSIAAAPSSPKPNRSSQKQIHRALSGYVSTIAQDDFIARLNDALRLCASKANHGDIRGYYASRPELREYTLGVELDRDMDYTLILESGEPILDKSAIRSHFEAEGRSDDDEGVGEIDAISDKELLIRAANQSLLADAMAALMGVEGAPSHHNPTALDSDDPKPQLILSDPLLHMGASVEKCHFIVDLQVRSVRAIGVLAMNVPLEDSRLVLARAILVANFVPGKKEPLQYAIHMIQAYHWPESRPLHDAAVSLARDHDLASKYAKTKKKQSERLDSRPKLFRSVSRNLASMFAASTIGGGDDYRRSMSY